VNYRVIVSRAAAKAITRLPDDVQDRVLEALSLLELDPFHPRLDIKNLKGKLKGLLRVRTGNYRIIYEIDHSARIVRVRQVVSRGSAY
jgi:mRNA interferase RelE/StbE